jgi:cytochrome c6
MSKRATHAAGLVLILLFATRTTLAQNAGADTYKAKCEMCHGADGLANTQMGKALAAHPYNAPEVRKLSDAELTAIIKNGKNSKMPAFGGQLTDAQIKDVLKYIHTLQK